MKKLLILSFSLLILLVVPAGSAVGQNETGIIATFTAGSQDLLPDGGIGNLFSGEKPKNLYAYMYDKAKFKPERVAVRRIIEEQTALSEADIRVLRNNVSTVYGFLPEGSEPIGPVATQAEISARQRELSTFFEDEREFAEFEEEIASRVEVTEIFANGSRDDSGFDLLYDLEVIGSILFGKEVTFFGTGGVTGGSGVRNILSGSADDSDRANEGPATPESGRGGEGAVNNVVPGGIEAAAPHEQFSPTACVADTGIDSAIRNFLSREKNGEIAKPGEAARFLTDGSDNVSGETPLSKEEKKRLTLIPDSAGNFRRARECIGPFCLEIKTLYKKDSSYAPTVSCIACHIEKMNDAFRKTIDQGLIPSKVTGNVLEPSVCKAINIGDIVGLDIIVIPSPIVTPPNDDIIIDSDAWEEFKKFDERYRPFMVHQLLEAIGAVESSQDSQELASIEASSASAVSASASDTTTIADIQRDLRAYSNQARDNQLRALSDADASGTAVSVAEEFQALSAEMEQFNLYFRNMSKLFGDMRSPCNTLENKPYCS